MESAIFGLRFTSNEDLEPDAGELKQFLERPKKDRGAEIHKDDLAKYVQHLKGVQEFEMRRRQGSAELDIYERKSFGVLSHSHFFSSALKSAIEQYKYHYHSFSALDFKKPRSFVRSAEEEIGRLNPKKKDDQAKIARLRDMIAQRNANIETLEKRRSQLSKELKNIAIYVRDNLIRIQKLCESSIVVLVDLQIGKEKEHQIIEDIRRHFKDEIRDYMQVGPVSRKFAENLKEEFSKLSKQLSQTVLEDVYSIARVYEQIHDHAKKFASSLDRLVLRIEAEKRTDFDEEKNVLGRVGQELILLITEYDFEIREPEDIQHKDEHERLLMTKRKEMLDHLFGLL